MSQSDLLRGGNAIFKNGAGEELLLAAILWIDSCLAFRPKQNIRAETLL